MLTENIPFPRKIFVREVGLASWIYKFDRFRMNHTRKKKESGKSSCERESVTCNARYLTNNVTKREKKTIGTEENKRIFSCRE